MALRRAFEGGERLRIHAADDESFDVVVFAGDGERGVGGVRHVAGDVGDVLERIERRLRGLAAVAVGEHAEGAVLGVTLKDAAAGGGGLFDAVGEAALDVGGHRAQITVWAVASVTAIVSETPCGGVYQIEDLTVTPSVSERPVISRLGPCSMIRGRVADAGTGFARDKH